MLSATIISFFKRGKKKHQKLFYEDFILMFARDHNIDITRVHGLELIRTLPFEEELYGKVADLVKDGNITAVKNMEIEEGLLGELALVTFTCQTGGPCAAILYDSYDTWEEPVVAEVVKL